MNSVHELLGDDSSLPFTGEGLDALTESFAALHDEMESAAKYLSIFIDEAEMTLDQMTERLLAPDAGKGDRSNLPERSDQPSVGARCFAQSGPVPFFGPDAVEQLLIDVHRIKGSAASVGLHRAAKLTHLMEDSMQEAVIAREALSTPVRNALLACTDGLREYVQSIKCGRSKTEDFPRLAQALLAAGEQSEKGTGPIGAEPGTDRRLVAGRSGKLDLSPFPAQANRGTQQSLIEGPLEVWRNVVFAATPEADRENTYLGRVVFQAGLPLAGLKGRLIYEKLTHVGEIRLFDPPVGQLEELETLDTVWFGVTSERPSAEIRKAACVAGIEQFLLEPLLIESCQENAACRLAAAGMAEKISANLRPDAPSAGGIHNLADVPSAAKLSDIPRAKPAETMRVEVQRLDGLMDLVGQLVTEKARFLQVQRNLVEIQRGGEARYRIRAAADDLSEAIDRLEHVAGGLRRGVMQIRMLPIGPLFRRFQRVIQDMTRASGKDIRLEIQGEKTELDKRMIDELGDPLIHLIRNAADHGVESPQLRQAAGKSRQGTITLGASQRGNRIFIQVADDGQGLDIRRIRARAVTLGLVAAADAERLTPARCEALIWRPGLSTVEKVTEVSGRGMGMDIVKAKIDELGGSVELQSTPGRGTAVTIKLPLTLAVLPSLLTEVGAEVYAFPLEAVAEIIRLKPKDLSFVHQQRTACLRGRVISVLRLDEVFALQKGNSKVESRGSKVESRESREDVRPSTFDLRPSTPDARSFPGDPELTLVIVGEPGRELGLVVDQVLGQQDMVIKSLANNFRTVPGIAGAGILGDGRISLILDIPAVLEKAGRTFTGKPRLVVAVEKD